VAFGKQEAGAVRIRVVAETEHGVLCRKAPSRRGGVAEQIAHGIVIL
jgi:hypothetical protein